VCFDDSTPGFKVSPVRKTFGRPQTSQDNVWPTNCDEGVVLAAMRPVNLPWIGAMKQYLQISVWISDAHMFDRFQHPQRFIPRLYE